MHSTLVPINLVLHHHSFLVIEVEYAVWFGRWILAFHPGCSVLGGEGL